MEKTATEAVLLTHIFAIFNYFPIEWKSTPCCSYLDRCTACPYRNDGHSPYGDTTAVKGGA